MWNHRLLNKFFRDKIKYKNWVFSVDDVDDVDDESDNCHYYLQIIFEAPDNFTGNMERQYCRKWLLSVHMTKTELVETAWKAVRMAEEHEAREQFKYKGQAIFNSHISVDKLCELCEKNGELVYDYRK